MDKNNIFNIKEPKEQLPEKHKKAVMDSIEFAKLMLDMADLFSNKRVRTETELLSSLSKTKSKKK